MTAVFRGVFRTLSLSMPDSIDFYKRVFLHLIPDHIIVLCFIVRCSLRTKKYICIISMHFCVKPFMLGFAVLAH